METNKWRKTRRREDVHECELFFIGRDHHFVSNVSVEHDDADVVKLHHACKIIRLAVWRQVRCGAKKAVLRESGEGAEPTKHKKSGMNVRTGDKEFCWHLLYVRTHATTGEQNIHPVININ